MSDRSRFQRAGGSRRRRTGWEPGPFTTSLSLTAAGKTAWSTTQEFLEDGLTVARIRGSLSLTVSSVGSRFDHFDAIAFGIGIASVQAIGIGATALPGPLSEIDWEGWIYHTIQSGMRGTALSPLGDAAGFVRVDIDTKAMRKVGTNQAIFGMVEAEVETGVVDVRVEGRTRMLLMLS